MPRRRLAREIAVVLVVKVLLLAGIFVLFFGRARWLELVSDYQEGRAAEPPSPPAVEEVH
ncbi:hypothetical protein SVA_1366 [Sulfurifustis variabilis]|uniref:Uncharacterized protein n=1 Tax=Sulfurifustis variabilis TaxID=1675686 RepID=A0A1B4VBF6_9GAMM|nr:cytochrome oxidase putative small subunit CydP [Sulfurifustis variabilis]BAU47931.1 hypothetical protein SVA_1366 [Sulfurifustis variabilis]